jgi:Ca2+-binding RTX toxin-like protein
MRHLVLLFTAMALALLLASGVAWAVNELGTNGRDTLRGTNGNDNLSGRGGNDRLLGLGGRDNLLGGPGKDVVLGGNEAAVAGGDKNLAGGTGNDAVFGGLGSDLVAGNEGNDLVADGPDREFSTDLLSAGEGNDVVLIFNDPPFKDLVSCGGGRDWVFADRKDVAAPDCERVADRPSEFQALFESIPQSFIEGLPPPFNQGP